MRTPIADLHCDLLSYLAQGKDRTADDPASHCSIPQMKQGGVIFQVMAIYEETKLGSAQSGIRQFSAFQNLVKTRAADVHLFKPGHPLNKPIAIALSIENASTLLGEEEKFALCIQRLEKMIREIGHIFYISLTWNQENRFGGGNASHTGLKREGELLLEFMNEHQIPVDLSHTSDPLAHGILNYIDKQKLKIKVIASHSNFRKIVDVPRNLPDEIAREIIRRKGLIGTNWFRHFVGKEPKEMILHIEHGLSLGAESVLCMGADYFAPGDSPDSLSHMKPFQFPGYDNASCYPKILELLQGHFPEKWIEQLAYKNFETFAMKITL